MEEFTKEGEPGGPLVVEEFVAAESQRLAMVIPMITGTVKFHSLNLVVFWKQCEACLTAS